MSMYDNNSPEDNELNNDYKITFAEQIVYAMFKPSRYKEILELGTKRFILFAIVLCLVLGIVNFAVPASAVITGFGGFQKLFSKNIGPFTYSDGVLKAEKKFDMTIGLYHIIIDTSENKISDDQMKKEGMYIAFGSSTLRMTMVANGQLMDYDTFDLSMLFMEGFNNEILIQMIPYIYIYLVIWFFATAINAFIKYGIYALIMSIYINAINKHNNIGLSYGKVFMLCFYGQTLGIILSNFNAALGLIPAIIVNIIGIFISFHMITSATILLDKRNQV